MAGALPPDLPAPHDDGAADDLPGTAMPAVSLVGTDGDVVRLDDLGTGRTIVYVYPLTGRPDVDRVLADELGLPTFTTAGLTLYRRHTIVVREAVIEHVFYPVFPPDRHAEQVRTWLALRSS